jgi:hypothetical protein
VEQAAIPVCEIVRDTLVGEVDPPLSKYEQRKLDGECTRCGCTLTKARIEDGESMCERCHEYVLEAKRRSAKTRRLVWKRKRLCGQCGKKRRPGGRLCPGCSVRFGAVPRHLVDHYVDQQPDRDAATWDARLEQSPDGKLRARRRYHGSGRRGRQSIERLDEQDMDDANRCIREGWQGLAYWRSPEVQALPRIQRDDVRREALAKLRQGQRWLEEIVERNLPKSLKSQEVADDE